MHVRRGIVVFLVLALLIVIWLPGQAQSSDRQYFSGTGNWVAGDFLTFYRSVPDPLLVFGYPITEEFTDPSIARRVQYFQRARFEFDPLAPVNEKVSLSSLGSFIEKKSVIHPADLATNTPMCRPFRNNDSETFYVCYAFLAFYDDHGGSRLFGNPISNYSLEGDRYVQYFERARFEWYPELREDQWVRLADVGSIEFDLDQPDRSVLTPVQGENALMEVTGLMPRAFVEKPLVKSTSSQTVYVVVRDQKLNPLSQALVSAVIHLPDGEQVPLRLPLSDRDGISALTFDLENMPVNQVISLDILVNYNGLQGKTTVWFRTWW
jgi:hypothetical protein